jgi:hypothetical protein
MADSTALVAAITGASTVAGGAGAALITALQQGRTARHQLEMEQKKVEGDIDRAALDRRLTTYCEFLDVERELRMLVASGREFTTDEYEQWLANFNRSFNLLALTGTPEAREEAAAMFNELDGIDRDRLGDESGETFAQKLRGAYQTHNAKMVEIRSELIETMSADVAPRGKRPAQTSR